MITLHEFKERALEDMSAHICVEPEMFAILVGFGVCGIKEGFNRYTYFDAITIIRRIDELLPFVPKYNQKRIRATRMSFVFAFGPEMEKRIMELLLGEAKK